MSRGTQASRGIGIGDSALAPVLCSVPALFCHAGPMLAVWDVGQHSLMSAKDNSDAHTCAKDSSSFARASVDILSHCAMWA